MTEPEPSEGESVADEEICTEIRTGVDYDGAGVTLAVKTIKRGDRRMDFRVGHLCRRYAETYDLYYQGELLHQGKLETERDRPTGGFLGGTYHEELDGSIEVEDDKIIETTVWEREGVDEMEWAERYIEYAVDHEDVIGEMWEVMKNEYDVGKLG